ncbi:MAG: DMT family transporter [Myxococcales bacterium]|nr:DMT family transporter [Myxococcales bacterium]
MSDLKSSEPPSRARLVLGLGVAVLAVSSAALWIRMAHAGPVTISFWRLAWASVLLGPVTVPAARDALPTLRRGDLWRLPLAGLCLALHFALWIASLAPASPYATSVAASASLVALHPVLVALVGAKVTGQHVPKSAMVGIALALVGAAVIAAGDASGGHHRAVGDLLAVLGAVAGAGYFLLGASLRARVSLRAYMGPVYGAAAVCLGLMAWLVGERLWVPWREHGLFVAMAVGPMIVGHGLLNWALGYLPAWAVSAVILAEPFASAVLVFAVLRERPPAAAVLGAATVVLGLVLVLRADARRAAGGAA